MNSVMVAEVKTPAKEKIALQKKAGLTIAAVSVVPLFAFAILWTSLLLLLGGLWVGHILFGI